jgi:hypothetical protein
MNSQFFYSSESLHFCIDGIEVAYCFRDWDATLSYSWFFNKNVIGRFDNDKRDMLQNKIAELFRLTAELEHYLTPGDSF